MPTIESAMAWLLHPKPTSTHVLVAAELPPQDIEALAGMVHEVTGGHAKLFVLGGATPPGAAGNDGEGIIRIAVSDAAAIEQALRAHPAAAPALPPAAPPGLSGDDLRAALHEGRLRVRFQPVLDAHTLRLVGVEALARLHHPSLGILRPAQFMPQAIETGQERALSSMAAARAVIELRGQAFMRDRSVAFNVPLPTFLHEQGPARALEICAIASHPTERVVIELVETSHLPDLRAVGAAVERWRRAGFCASIDDAGPRLPHWRDLLELPFSGVKLDGALAQNTREAIAGAELIVSVAKRLGKYVIAEGIEDSAAVDRLRGLEVDAFQGYFFCRPVPVPALRIWAEAWDSLISAGATA
jgi:EAL domain-containing protein (putative c-di-GMP-specific phosphodiesterase class I)